MSSKTKTTDVKEEAKTALVPKLRFPEFRDEAEWRVRKLNELLFETKTRNRNLELGPTDVLSVSGEYGCVNQIEFMGRSYAGVSVKDYHVVEHGDIVYTKSPLKKNPFGIIKENKGKRGIVSTLYAVYRPFPDTSATYLDHFFSRDYNLNAYLQPIVKKGAKNDMKVNNADVLTGDICVPKLPEQHKIAECLSSLDELISAQGRKVDALKTHKKGLMQQLFPREGETQPRLRFPEFQDAGEWEEGKLISLSSEPLSNGVFNDPKKVGSGYKLINVSDMYIDTTIDEARLSLLELAAPDFRANQVMQGDIFFTRSSLVKSGIAVSNIYLGNSDDVTYDGHLIRLRPDTNKVVPLFAHYLFKTPPIRAHLIARGKSATMTTIGQADVASVTLCYPPKAEQQRLATCLSSLDDLITAETQKIEAFKTHKKGLMQQLFPSPEEVEA
jgi:type I restriction enzyme S subunit